MKRICLYFDSVGKVQYVDTYRCSYETIADYVLMHDRGATWYQRVLEMMAEVEERRAICQIVAYVELGSEDWPTVGAVLRGFWEWYEHEPRGGGL